MPNTEMLLIVLTLLVVVLAAWVLVRLGAVLRHQAELAAGQEKALGAQHQAMLKDLHQGLALQSDRTQAALTDTAERLRQALEALRLEQTQSLAAASDALKTGQQEFLNKTLSTFADQGREQQKLIQDTIARLSGVVDGRLAEISGKVSERLDEGFKKTNETFANVMARLATIDEAQKKIDGLTTNVVTLQELLGDKRSRGAFGEVQLEALVRNILPPGAYEFQATLSNKSRADCLLTLPEPTGKVAVDSKFPLENYNRMFDSALAESERTAATRAFKADVKKHIEDIASKYIIEHETSDGAVMFVPAEAVFAEIHAYHGDLVDYAMQRRVWIVSPTTLMAVLNTARAVIKDVETRRQVHIIKEELSRLGKDFGRFEERMKKLATHIRQANDDVQDVQISSDKISKRFRQIESVDLEHLQAGQPLLADKE
ncbi:DNA recombination protein RmuC [Betaproteobacteria bacterium SCN2]|jgi:DNA recombination protein RmuC|nr:DNA recombination protein RmuC [Betaproteobacteria bacterium SCN2]